MNGQAIERPAIATSISEVAPQGAWRWSKLSDLARLESGHTPSRSRLDWWGGDVSWLSLTEIRAFDGQWVDETQLKTNEAGIANSAARILPRGTVCLSRTASVGFVAIMGRPMATSQDFANWVCGDDLDPEFLMYALIMSRRFLREIATGATHKTIYMPALRTFHICHPNRDQQKKIVVRLKAHLAEVTKARQAAQAQLQDVATLKSRALQTLFSGIANSAAIGSAAKLQSGYAFKSDSFKSSGVRLLRNANILPDKVYWADAVFLSEDDSKKYRNYALSAGDVLISLDRPIISSGVKVARVGSSDLPSLLVQRVGRFLINPEMLDADYLYAYLQTDLFISEISGHDQSLGVPHIAPSQVERIVIPLPEVAVQGKLSKQLNEVTCTWRAAASALEAQLNDLSKLTKAILAHAFEI